MELVRGQVAEGRDGVLIGKVVGFFEGAPRYQFGRHARGGDGRAAAEGLEPRLGDALAADLQTDFHHVAERRRADFTHAVRVLHLAHVARIEEVVQNELAVGGVHGSVRFSLPKLLAPAGCGNSFRKPWGKAASPAFPPLTRPGMAATAASSFCILHFAFCISPLLASAFRPVTLSRSLKNNRERK